MGKPGYIPGGTTLLDGLDAQLEASDYGSESVAQLAANQGLNNLRDVPAEAIGVFSSAPGATPKYAINDGRGRDNEFKETMARLFIQVGIKERDRFVQSVPAESQALAKILCGAGSGAAGGTGFIDFLLQQVNESFQEKIQVVESLSDNFIIYTFGQKAPVFQYGGTLLNTYQDDQRVWMTRMYRDIIRATQLARRKKLVRLRYDSVIVSGVLIGMNQALDGRTENAANFGFQFIPTQYVIFTPAVGYPAQLKTPFTEGGKFGLASTRAPNTKRMKVAAASSASAPARKVPGATKSQSPWVANNRELQKKYSNAKFKVVKSERLNRRATPTNKKPVEDQSKTLRGGTLPKSATAAQ